MSAENVSVVFDRRKKVESTGQGMLEIRVYLGKRVRRYYSIGKFSPRQWKKVAQFNSSVFGAWLRQPEYGA